MIVRVPSSTAPTPEAKSDVSNSRLTGPIAQSEAARFEGLSDTSRLRSHVRPDTGSGATPQEATRWLS